MIHVIKMKIFKFNDILKLIIDTKWKMNQFKQYNRAMEFWTTDFLPVYNIVYYVLLQGN